MLIYFPQQFQSPCPEFFIFLPWENLKWQKKQLPRSSDFLEKTHTGELGTSFPFYSMSQGTLFENLFLAGQLLMQFHLYFFLIALPVISRYLLAKLGLLVRP